MTVVTDFIIVFIFGSSKLHAQWLSTDGQWHISGNSRTPGPYLLRKNTLGFIMSLRDPFCWSSDYHLGSPLSDSEEPRPPPAQRKTAKRARKPRTDQCKAWKFNGVVNVDVFAGKSTDGMTVEAKTNMLKEWLRVGNEKPPVVLSMTVLVNSADYPHGAC